jgi:tetratricopeptide (TPR) repeat protein
MFMGRRLNFSLFFLLVVCTTGMAQPNSDSPLSQSWVLGSKLSLAGTLHSQGGDAATVGRQFAAASAAATSLGIKLPALPARKGNKVEDSATVLHYLLNTTGNPIGGILGKSYGPEHAAIFEVALKSNMLLTLYGPGESMANTIAGVIRSRSGNAKFLGAMTAKLLQLIEQKAPYEQVKTELFSIHEYAPKFIAVIEYGRNGEMKYAAKDYSGSAVEFTKAIGIDPEGAEYYFGRGRAYMQLSKNNEAIADYTKMIQLEGSTRDAPKNLSVAYHNRGLLYGMTGKNALAITDLTKAINLRPDYASAYKVRGLVYKQMGNAKLSAADLQKAEQLQPGITR